MWSAVCLVCNGPLLVELVACCHSSRIIRNVDKTSKSGSRPVLGDSLTLGVHFNPKGGGRGLP